MSKQSYMTGFCKAASAAGVDPQALAQYVMSHGAEKQAQTNEIKSVSAPVPMAPPAKDVKDEKKKQIFNILRRVVNAGRAAIRSANPLSSPRPSDINAVRKAVMSTDYDPREFNLPTFYAGLSPENQALYSRLTNAFDVATAPYAGAKRWYEAPGASWPDIPVTGPDAPLMPQDLDKIIQTGVQTFMGNKKAK